MKDNNILFMYVLIAWDTKKYSLYICQLPGRQRNIVYIIVNCMKDNDILFQKFLYEKCILLINMSLDIFFFFYQLSFASLIPCPIP